jgi:ribosome-associated protein YbcJ (S4-like RNA binding protein)
MPDNIPQWPLPPEPISLKHLLVSCGAVASASEAKRLIVQRAVSIDGVKTIDPNQEITPAGQVVRVGKLIFGQIEVVEGKATI